MTIPDIEYELEEKYIRGFRAIFEKDMDFSYNDNSEESQVIITTEFPENDLPFKTPHIIVAGIEYEMDLQQTFQNNFFDDYLYDGMVNGAQKYATMIPFSATFICKGEWSASKDLANRLVQYLSHIAYAYFHDQLGLEARKVVKGRTNAAAQFPEKIFDTTVSLQGNMNWVGIRKQDGFLTGLDTPVANSKINITNI